MINTAQCPLVIAPYEVSVVCIGGLRFANPPYEFFTRKGA